MLAFALVDLRDWRELRMRKITMQSALAMALVAEIVLARPLPLALTATAIFLLFGWMEGKRYLSDKDTSRTLTASGFDPGSIVAGRALTALTTWGFIALVVSPPLALSAIAWGQTSASLASCALSWLVAYLASFGVGLLSSIAFSRTEGLPGILALALWLGSAFFSPSLASLNPFVQDWDFLNEAGGVSPFVGMGAEALAAAFLFAAVLWPLSRTRRKKP